MPPTFPESASRSAGSPPRYGKQKTSDSSSTSSWASQGESPIRYGGQKTPDSANTSSWFSEEDSSYSTFSPSFEHHVDPATLFGEAEFKSPCAVQKPICPLKAERKVYGRPPLPQKKAPIQPSRVSTPIKEPKFKGQGSMGAKYNMPKLNLQLDTPVLRNESRQRPSWESPSMKTPPTLDSNRFRERNTYPGSNFGRPGLNLFSRPTFGIEEECPGDLSPISEHSSDNSQDSSHCSDTESPIKEPRFKGQSSMGANYNMPRFNLQLDTPVLRNESRQRPSWESPSMRTGPTLDTNRFRERKTYPGSNFGRPGLNLFGRPTFGIEEECPGELSPISEHSSDNSQDSSHCSDIESPSARSPVSRQLSPGSPYAREYSTSRQLRGGSEGETGYGNRSIDCSESDSGSLYSLSDIFTPPMTPNTPPFRQDSRQPEFGDDLRPRALFSSPTK